MSKYAVEVENPTDEDWSLYFVSLKACQTQVMLFVICAFLEICQRTDVNMCKT